MSELQWQQQWALSFTECSSLTDNSCTVIEKHCNNFIDSHNGSFVRNGQASLLGNVIQKGSFLSTLHPAFIIGQAEKNLNEKKRDFVIC